MDDVRFNELLVSAVTPVVSEIREGDYSWDEVDVYCTFSYYSQGDFYANNRPAVKRWRVMVTLWARRGVDVRDTRSLLRRALCAFSGAYPTCQVSVDDGWKQYVYEFTYVGGAEEWPE